MVWRVLRLILSDVRWTYGILVLRMSDGGDDDDDGGGGDNGGAGCN